MWQRVPVSFGLLKAQRQNRVFAHCVSEGRVSAIGTLYESSLASRISAGVGGRS